ncbi:hypothetical protein [Desulfosarcina sp.]|uniref:hypothetical protein n=1 Tax=Desulfosarcina sp. TaxID=2027861 RepID=UPI003563FF80
MRLRWALPLKTSLLAVLVGACMATVPLSMQVRFSSPPFRIGLQPASAAEKYGILGREAPELDLNTWIDGDGEAIAPVRLGDFRGSVVYLNFFQDYRSGGTPWTVVIGPAGQVVYNGFRIEADEAKPLIDRLIGDMD